MEFLFLLNTLACFRLTRLITDDKITDWLRSWVIRSVPKRANRKVKQGITCPFCVSFYLALLLTGYMMHVGQVELLGAPLWLAAVWGGSVIWNQIFVKLS